MGSTAEARNAFRRGERENNSGLEKGQPRAPVAVSGFFCCEGMQRPPTCGLFSRARCGETDSRFIEFGSEQCPITTLEYTPPAHRNHQQSQLTSLARSPLPPTLQKTITEKKAIEGSRVSDQKAVDAALLGAIKGEPMLKAYLAASFSLKKGQYPHALKL